MKKTNSEGLTWVEWLHATYYQTMSIAVQQLYGFHALRQAWTDGEDPTEWRKALSDLEARTHADAS